MIDVRLVNLKVLSGCFKLLPQFPASTINLIQSKITQDIYARTPDSIRERFPAILAALSTDHYKFEGRYCDGKKGKISFKNTDNLNFFPERTKFSDDSSFDHRRELIIALFHTSVHSASFVPNDPSQEQTLYMSQFFVHEKIWSTIMINHFCANTYSFGNDVGNLAPILQLNQNPNTEKTKLKGFVAPYDKFSSIAFDTDREYTAPKINVFATNNSVEIFTSKIGNSELKERMKNIWKLFKADAHSKELALTLFDTAGQGRILRIHLIKD